jgi:hypothetical protein
MSSASLAFTLLTMKDGRTAPLIDRLPAAGSRGLECGPFRRFVEAEGARTRRPAVPPPRPRGRGTVSPPRAELEVRRGGNPHAGSLEH